MPRAGRVSQIPGLFLPGLSTSFVFSNSSGSGVMAFAVANRDARLKELQQTVDRIHRIIEIRSKTMAHVPAGATGLLVRDSKGKNGDVSVYRVDTAFLAELRSALRQAAEELGQWPRGPGRPRIRGRRRC